MFNIKRIFNNIFLLFLVFYFISILVSILKVNFSFLTIILYIVGFLFSVFAHAKRNYISVILLVTHMTLEWFEWSQKNFTKEYAILSLIHILMDFIFLSHELSAHIKKYKYQALFSISLFLIFIFTFSKLYLSNIEGIQTITQQIEPFIVAGIFGCVGSHLLIHIKSLIKNKGKIIENDCCKHNH